MEPAVMTLEQSNGTIRRHSLSKAQLLALLAYSVILLAATAVHTFWRDESECWLIARASSSLSSLLHNTRYQGHPPLWYFILYVITRMTWNVEWMKLPNFISAVVAAILIMRAKGPHLAIRLGLVFSYYMLFEYGVIARNYMIGIALLLSAVTLMKRKQSAIIPIVILLSMAALSSLPALIVATCLFAFYLCQLIAAAEYPRVRLSLADPRATALAAAFFGLSVLVSLAMMRPPADSILRDTFSRGRPGFVDRALMSGFWLGRGYLAVPDWQHNFWEARHWSGATSLLIAMFGYAALLGFSSYLRNRSVQWFFLVATGCLMVEVVACAAIAQRHLGWFFIVFMVALLLDDKDSTECRTRKPILAKPLPALLVAVTLICQVTVGFFAIAMGFKYPFSSSKRVANYIRQQHLEQATLVSKPFYTAESVLAYLQRDYAYDLQRHQYMPFVIWDREEFFDRRAQPDARIFHSLGQHGVSPILITETPLTSSETTELNVKPLASFTDAICSPDAYYLYTERDARRH
jgi:hypothetical protein